MTPRQKQIAGFVAFALFIVFVAVLPAFVSDFKARDYSYVGIYLIALLGLNILTGYTGQISLGHGAFMAIGAYTTAILMVGNEQFGGPISGGMKDVWTLPIAGLVAGLVGLAFGVPALRLSGLYLALATFAVAVAMPSTLRRFEEFTGGSTASSSPARRSSPARLERRDPRQVADPERLDVLPRLVDRARRLRGRVARAPRAGPAARSAPCATRRPRPSPRA